MTQSSSPPAARTLWIDVEDLFHYAQHNPRPSGIQRLVYEILRVIGDRAALLPEPPQIRFARRGADGAPLSDVRFDEIAALFSRLSGSDEKKSQAAVPDAGAGRPGRRQQITGALRSALKSRSGQSPVRWLRHTAIRELESLPTEISAPLLSAAVSQIRVLRQIRRLLRDRKVPPVTVPSPVPEAAPVTAPAPEVQAGDIFLIPGAAWSDPLFGERLRQIRETHGLRPVVLLYDLIPARRPEWCARSLVRDFRHWLDTTLPQCSDMLAISHATAQDVMVYAREESLALSAPVQVIPLGTGFGLTAGDTTVADGEIPPGLPEPGSYVLFVSTLEARKNHMLLFRVWQRLITETGRENVPTLVFAGRVGWLVADLMQQLDNTDWLDGKIRLLSDPTDAELRQLYRGCLFTVFPSLFEGWGLPVTESLMLGRPCVASSVTSVPEAGGKFARYFNPENTDEATAVIRNVLDSPDDLAAWTKEVETSFPRIPWEATADAVLKACMQAGKPSDTAGESAA